MPKKTKTPAKISLIMPVVNRYKKEKQSKTLAYGGYTMTTRKKKKIKLKVKEEVK